MSNTIVVYESYGIAINLGVGAWTTLRKVSTQKDENSPIMYCISFDFGSPGVSMPYDSEDERNAHWDRIIAALRTQAAADKVVAANTIPPGLMRPFEKR